MGYVETNLGSGENIIHRGEIHWAIYIPGTVLLLFVIGIFFLIPAFITKFTTEMAITNKRVIIKTGLISRRTIEMNLSKIENVAIDQSIFGRMLNYGTITVVGTGGTKEPFKWVADPLEFRRVVQAQSPD
ncbi:MAG: putative membrane protein YdbT with pleckstrin-like domain [Desulforhopalus sp.]|jgi:uncharacterized membrane protein YdbT with pleckstrin-like domain